jgi:hypothetical protein
MAWGGGGPVEDVLWAGRGGKAVRERRRPRVAVASGSAGAGGVEDVVSRGAVVVGHGFLPSLRCCGGGALFGYGRSSSPSLTLPVLTPMGTLWAVGK